MTKMPESIANDEVSSETNTLGTCAVLTDYALFSASGSNAATFLHGQLTNDVTGLSPSQARLAGFCTAKGRLLATMALWQYREGEETCIQGFMRQSLIESVIKRLRMFVLRAKVKFDTPAGQLHGVWAQAEHVSALSQKAGGTLPTVAWQSAQLATGTWICAPHPAGTLRWWWVTQPSQQDSSQALFAALGTGSEDAWRREDLCQGLPWIEAPTQDLFIPQTVNLDLIEGVSFTKGCYPGQEIVARSHYLGKVKRRMTLGTVSGVSQGVPALAADVFEPGNAAEPCGRVIDAASDTSDIYVLLETTLAAMALPELRLGSVDGPVIRLKPLPYALA